MEHPCPHCGAPLPEDASFCPHCTRSIRPRKPVQVPVHLWRKGLKIAALVLMLAAAAGLLALLLRSSASAGMPEGEVHPVVLTEDEDGMVRVTAELMREYFPRVTYINFSTTSLTSSSIDDYLAGCFQMAALVSSQGTGGSDGEWGMFDARNAGGSRLCLLLFDHNTHLMGYCIGPAANLGDGQWQLDVTLCDYDFTGLYLEQSAAFENQWQELFSTYIPPEELDASGVVWFLKGYNTGRGPVLRKDDSQIYRLWHQFHGPDMERQCREIERLEEFLPDEGRWMCYLLLDADYNLLGYTMLDYQGNGG
ncbi:zinc ribbon domain-containing protein [uncultured Pseudoflavonifractor sp.]|uniref:zinc ribbon domain-containing protein n=1 Tax=uncultured Pseudoflavonifractor sp. TaxID=1221379 RepID=UPI0025DC75DF|nr:zinc ribbon domain-containing protein [uncultured Pseudoflavonifractor sp.]